jgi:ornithine--oxo-acid transaminase
LIGIEFDHHAGEYCDELKEEGVLAHETHQTVIRFAPPLVITKEEIDWAVEKIKKVLDK